MLRIALQPIVYALIATLSLNGCSSGGGGSGTRKDDSTQPVIDSSGKKIYKVDPATGATISANGMTGTDPTFANAALVIPPGALSIPVDISIFQAQPLVSTATASAVGSTSLTAAGPAVAVLPSQTVSITNSLAISIPYTAQTALTENRQLVVLAIYPGASKSELETFLGNELDTTTPGVIKLSITRFGAFQVAYSESKVEKKKVETTITIEQKTSTSTTDNSRTTTGVDFPPQNPYAAYIGRWSTGCTNTDDAENPAFFRHSVDIAVDRFGKGDLKGTIKVFSDPNCAEASLVHLENRVENINFIGASPSISGSHEVDSRTTKIDITTYDSAVTICGKNFAQNVKTSISEAECTNDDNYKDRFKPSKDLVKVVGNMLFTGDCPNGTDCSTTRPTSLGKNYLIRDVPGQPTFEIIGPTAVVEGACTKFTLSRSGGTLTSPIRVAQNQIGSTNGLFYFDNLCLNQIESPVTLSFEPSQTTIDLYYKSPINSDGSVIDIRDAANPANSGLANRSVIVTTFDRQAKLDELKGVWTTGCLDETPATPGQNGAYSFQSARTIFSFDSNQLKITTFTYGGSPTCEPKDLHKIVESNASILLGPPDAGTNGLHKIDIDLIEDKVTPKSRAEMAFLNGVRPNGASVASQCGEEFKLGQATLLNKSICQGQPKVDEFRKIYTVLTIENGLLKIGEPTDASSGSTPGSRIVSLLSHGLQKIADIIGSASVPVTPLFGAWETECLIGQDYMYKRSVRFIDRTFSRVEKRYGTYDTECQYQPEAEFHDYGSFTFSVGLPEIQFVRKKAFAVINNSIILENFNGIQSGSTPFCGGGYQLTEPKEISASLCNENDPRLPTISDTDSFQIDQNDKLLLNSLSSYHLSRLTELEGGFQTRTCQPLPGSNLYMDYLMKFTGSQFEAYRQIYNNSNCDAPSYVYSVKYEGTFTATSQINAPSKLNTTIENISIWFASGSTSLDTYYSEICPSGSRENRLEILNITPQACGRPATQFNIYNLGGNSLSLGQLIGSNTANGIGSTEATRPTNFNGNIDMNFGITPKASSIEPPPQDGGGGNNGDNSGNGSTLISLTPEINAPITSGDCARFNVSATSTLVNSISFMPISIFSNGSTPNTQFYSDDRCKNSLPSPLTLNASSSSLTLYFKGILPSEASPAYGEIRMQTIDNGQTLSNSYPLQLIPQVSNN